MSNQARADPQRYCYTDLLTWEGERWELIDGEPYNLAPSPLRRHQEVSGSLFVLLYQHLEGKPCRVYSAPSDVRLPRQNEDGLTATTVVQPDIFVVCEQEKLDDRGCVGAPTLVIEVLSTDSTTRDRREKFKAYEAAGVKEYWLVSPLEKVIEVFLLDEKGRYGAPTVYADAEPLPVQTLDGIIIDLGRVFAE